MLEMLLIGASLAAAPADVPVCRRETLTRAVDRYANAQLVQDNASLATVYGTDGVLIAPDKSQNVGSEKVMAYFDRFNNWQIDDATMTVASTTKQGDAWQVDGRFAQSGKDDKGKPFKTTGRFTSTWACVTAGEITSWRIKRMETIPGG
jgi:ketosteroid isomerase-like protein